MLILDLYSLLCPKIILTLLFIFFKQEKIKALRAKHSGQYNNIACIRTNAMKFLPNFFHKVSFITYM